MSSSNSSCQYMSFCCQIHTDQLTDEYLDNSKQMTRKAQLWERKTDIGTTSWFLSMHYDRELNYQINQDKSHNLDTRSNAYKETT